MWFTLEDQTVWFLMSIAVGAALAAVYDIIRAARMLCRAGRAAVMAGDIIFFAFCGVVTSMFALPFNKGNVRAFVVFGEAVGFLAYRLTVGSIFGKFYSVLADFLRHITRKISQFLKFFYDFLLKAAGVMLYNIKEVLVAFLRTLSSGLGMLASERRASARERAERKSGKVTRNRASRRAKGRRNNKTVVYKG